jgi:hypothetical protein
MCGNCDVTIMREILVHFIRKEYPSYYNRHNRSRIRKELYAIIKLMS